VGEWKEFYSDGATHVVRNYNDEGGYHGMFNVYYPDGSLRRSDRYKNDKLKEGKCYTASGADTSWFSYEIRPEFPGGEQKRIEYLLKKTVYPKAARETGIQGVVYASFVVEKDGSIGEVKILRGVHPLLDAEAIRVISAMPRWKPGLIDGRPVRVKYNMPMSFKLTK
jgi:TonB family protein